MAKPSMALAELVEKGATDDVPLCQHRVRPAGGSKLLRGRERFHDAYQPPEPSKWSDGSARERGGRSG